MFSIIKKYSGRIITGDIMELNRKVNNFKSADLECYDLNEYYKKTSVNDFGINTSKSVIKDFDKKIFEQPKKFYNQLYFNDEN